NTQQNRDSLVIPRPATPALPLPGVTSSAPGALSNIALAQGARSRYSGRCVADIESGDVDEKVPVIEGSSRDSSEAEQPATDIFISYRHEDAPGRATALKQVLVEHCGAPHVFMDGGAIMEGTNVVSASEDHVVR